MASHYDGAHCGLGDWYPEIEQGIVDALAKGSEYEWTTGYYSSKKEIASANISCSGGEIEVEVSVSDDFDTPGQCSKKIPFTTDLDEIRQAIYDAWDDANEDQKDNRPYTGFSVMTEVEAYGLYIGGKPQGTPVKRQGWVESYIRCDDHWLEDPPGDCYHQWGFQEEYEIPDEIKEQMAKWAENWGIEHDEKELVCGEFTIKPWNEE